MKSRPYSTILWILFLLFCFRVLAQLFQYFFNSELLPPFESFQSGTLPYGLLLIFQLIIILIYARIAFRVSKGTIIARKERGRRLVALGSIYLGVMLTRYMLRMAMFPSERWFGGTIPIFFHIILALFIITIGIYHKKKALVDTQLSKWARTLWYTSCFAIPLLITAWLAYQLLPSFIASKLGIRGPVYSVSIEKAVPIPTADNLILYADVYKPEKLKPAPSILVRIPLDNNFKGKFMSNILGRLWAERGYNVIIQGVRGRFQSQGKHIPFQTEREDGIATLKWLNRQNWHNGKCGMWGGSYFGYTQWVLFDQEKLGLQALFTQISSSSNYKMFYPGGAFSFQSALFWATRSYSKIDTPLDYEQLMQACKRAAVIKADDEVTGDISFYNDWVKHQGFDAFWQKADGNKRAENLKVPILMMAGWYDPYLASQVQDFEDLSSRGASNIAFNSKLIIGPWAHAETVQMPGYIDDNYRLASIAPSMGWFDKQLKGSGGKQTPRVRLFVMGINKWRYENEFPLKRTKYTSYYLSDFTKPIRESGSLDSLPPARSSSKGYFYNPANPVLALGGSFLGENAGPKVQNEVEKRKDVLVYSTQKLDKDIEVTGKIKLILYVSSSARNTDFIAKLIDVHPNGDAYNISEGIIRRNYSGKDMVEEIQIDLNPTSNVFLKGHQIRLQVMSSNFPRYDINYNTGGLNYEENHGPIVAQKVYTGKSHLSRLILPVIPGK